MEKGKKNNKKNSKVQPSSFYFISLLAASLYVSLFITS